MFVDLLIPKRSVSSDSAEPKETENKENSNNLHSQHNPSHIYQCASQF